MNVSLTLVFKRAIFVRGWKNGQSSVFSIGVVHMDEHRYHGVISVRKIMVVLMHWKRSPFLRRLQMSFGMMEDDIGGRHDVLASIQEVVIQHGLCKGRRVILRIPRFFQPLVF